MDIFEVAKMNWARRPLTTRMEEYARNDTRFLKRLSDMLRGELAAQQHELWRVVGARMQSRLGARPVWLSTAGMGVSRAGASSRT